jgi:hypothetical protein
MPNYERNHLPQYHNSSGNTTEPPLVATSQCLETSSQYLVISSQYLVISSQYLVTFSQSQVTWRLGTSKYTISVTPGRPLVSNCSRTIPATHTHRVVISLSQLSYLLSQLVIFCVSWYLSATVLCLFRFAIKSGVRV